MTASNERNCCAATSGKAVVKLSVAFLVSYSFLSIVDDGIMDF